MKARIFDSAGNALGGDLAVNTSAVASTDLPHVTALATGGFVVSFTSRAAPAPESGYGARARMFDANGTAIGGEIQLNSRVLGFQGFADVAATADGGFVAVWIEEAQTNTIRAQVFDAIGGRIGGEVAVNTGTFNPAADVFNLSAATLSDGRVVVTWEGNYVNGGDASGSSIHSQIIDPRDGNIEGTNAGDKLYGHDLVNDEITGFAGNDMLFGLDGNDGIYAGDGDDSAYGGLGSDYLFGGTGADVLIGDENGGAGVGNDHMAGNIGSDTLFGCGGDDVLIGDDEGGAGADNDVLYGMDGNDTAFGCGGNDVTYGADGADSLYGNQGDDFEIGNAGADLLNGNEGNDVLIGDDEGGGGTGNDVIYGNAGNDTLFGCGGADVLIGDEAGGAGNGNDALYGGAGNDALYGCGGDDYLVGGADFDVLNGGDGNDILIGDFEEGSAPGSGSDTLIGGPGQDAIYTGLLQDQVWFDVAPSAANADHVYDFTVGPDRIGLASSIYGAANAGGGSVRFISGAGAAANTGGATIIYDTSTHNLFYDVDGTGAGAAELIATFDNGPALTASVFFFF